MKSALRVEHAIQLGWNTMMMIKGEFFIHPLHPSDSAPAIKQLVDSLPCTTLLWAHVNNRHVPCVVFTAAHNLYYILCLGMALPTVMPSALNIFQLMDQHPRGTVMHFIHTNVWVYLDPFLQLPFVWLLPFGRYFCHSSANTEQLSLIHAAWIMHHKSRA